MKGHQAILFIAVILLIDQVVKLYIKSTMIIGQEHIIFDWFRIHFVENKGMAFGMTLGSPYGKLILSLFRIIAVFFIGYILKKLIDNKASWGLVASISLIFAGAMGNILDSLFYGLLFSDSYGHVATFMPPEGGYASFLHGRVVDMLYFPLIEGHYPEWAPIIGGQYFQFFRPVFNIADSAITVGVLSILLFQRSFFMESDTFLNGPTSNTNSEESPIAQ